MPPKTQGTFVPPPLTQREYCLVVAIFLEAAGKDDLPNVDRLDLAMKMGYNGRGSSNAAWYNVRKKLKAAYDAQLTASGIMPDNFGTGQAYALSNTAEAKAKIPTPSSLLSPCSIAATSRVRRSARRIVQPDIHGSSVINTEARGGDGCESAPRDPKKRLLVKTNYGPRVSSKIQKLFPASYNGNFLITTTFNQSPSSYVLRLPLPHLTSTLNLKDAPMMDNKRESKRSTLQVGQNVAGTKDTQTQELNHAPKLSKMLEHTTQSSAQTRPNALPIRREPEYKLCDDGTGWDDEGTIPPKFPHHPPGSRPHWWRYDHETKRVQIRYTDSDIWIDDTAFHARDDAAKKLRAERDALNNTKYEAHLDERGRMGDAKRVAAMERKIGNETAGGEEDEDDYDSDSSTSSVCPATKGGPIF